MDVQKKLDEIAATVANARSMPMSASCVVNRAELLAMLDEVSAALPDSLAQAEDLLGDREQMVEQARAEARRIIDSAHAERGSLVSDTHVARQSKDEAERIVAEARREADEIRAEADDYVDSKLANFEVVLTKTIGSVDRGREKLLGRHPEFDEQGFPLEDDPDAPERSADPETLRRRADEYVDTKLGAFEAVLSKTLEAVGRGRLKLTGHNPIDDLAAQIAAADGADADPQHHHRQSDADYLAGLAAPAPEQADLAQYGYDPQPKAAEPQQQPQQDPGYGYPPQPEAYPQQGYVQETGDGYQQEYAQQAGYADPYAPQPGYGQDQGYDYSQQQGYEQQPGYDQQQYPPQIPYQQQGQPQGYAQPPAALDETSFFDTGMIDLNRLRELEQGR
ncbi:ATP synthase F0 subunit B [Streptomyces sp. NBC_01198]|uniref:ATP synthase F0 subunit B n=1 Tax=Streptomyces sp. NBC_01198 TaxID=2903769 RepID=UPI002E0F98FA|nr:ATP synthase F0 subunit B [Streptomyces sp. NBC_01198]